MKDYRRRKRRGLVRVVTELNLVAIKTLRDLRYLMIDPGTKEEIQAAFETFVSDHLDKV
jgi:hypothetical protein